MKKRTWLVGGLVAIFYFPISWVANHPNWRTPIFQRGGPTTNQIYVSLRFSSLVGTDDPIDFSVPRYRIVWHMSLHLKKLTRHYPCPAPQIVACLAFTCLYRFKGLHTNIGQNILEHVYTVVIQHCKLGKRFQTPRCNHILAKDEELQSTWLYFIPRLTQNNQTWEKCHSLLKTMLLCVSCLPKPNMIPNHIPIIYEIPTSCLTYTFWIDI